MYCKMRFDTMKVGEEAAWLTVTKVITMLINMVITMFLSRFRTLTEYGTYSQIYLIATIATSIFVLGLPASLNYFLNRTEDKICRQEFLSVYFTFGSLLGIIIAILLLVLYPFVVKYFNNNMLFTYKFAVLLLPWISIFNNSVDNLFIAYHKTAYLMLYRLLYSIMLFITVVLFALNNGNFYTYMIIYISVQTIFVIGLYYAAYRMSGKLNILIKKNLIIEILQYCIPLGIAAIVSTLNIELDKLMIGRFYSTDAMAVYTNVSKELPINLLTVAVTTVMLPKMVSLIGKNKKQEAIEAWGVSIELSAVVLCFACMILFVFSDIVINILYSAKYLEGNNIFKVYVITSLVKITSWGIVLNATNNTKLVLKTSVITLLINVVLNFLLLKLFGMIGAAVATLISEFFGIALKLFYTANVIGYKYKDVIPWKKIGQILFINVLLGVIVYILNMLFSNNIQNLYIRSCICVGMSFIIYFSLMQKKLKMLWLKLNDV